MDKQREKIVVLVILGLFAALNIALLIAIGFGASTVLEDEKLVDHTNRVISEVEIADNLYKTADWTARNRNFSGNENLLLAGARNSALESLERLKQIVSDNDEQTKILDLQIQDMPNRFKAQDEQFSAVIRQNGSITYPTEASLRGAQYAEKIELQFSNLKLNEQNLLQKDRLPKVRAKQWRLLYVFFGLVCADLLCLAVVGFKYVGVIGFIISMKQAVRHVKENPTDDNWQMLEDFVDEKRTQFNLTNAITSK